MKESVGGFQVISCAPLSRRTFHPSIFVSKAPLNSSQHFCTRSKISSVTLSGNRPGGIHCSRATSLSTLLIFHSPKPFCAIRHTGQSANGATRPVRASAVLPPNQGRTESPPLRSGELFWLTASTRYGDASMRLYSAWVPMNLTKSTWRPKSTVDHQAIISSRNFEPSRFSTLDFGEFWRCVESGEPPRACSGSSRRNRESGRSESST
jgi:hypothetical protein